MNFITSPYYQLFFIILSSNSLFNSLTNSLCNKKLFEVKTSYSIRDLAINQLDHCEEYSTRILLKTIGLEHVQRVGIVYGPCINFSSVAWYEYYIINKTNINPSHFKIKKKIIYE